MANEAARYGFRPVSAHAPTHEYVYSGAKISKGDPVSIISSAGYITVAATTSGSLCGIAAETKAAAATGKIMVWDGPQTWFKVTSASTVAASNDGTLTQAHIGQRVDVTGTTSQFQICILATEGTVQIMRVVTGETLGTNCQVEVQIARHQFNNDTTA